MMRVQKGLVKYKDRSDILCTYGTTDDGKTYYFLDGEKLSNGYIIASTALVEAIDPLVVASSIGIIDIDGNVIVPFENKSIRPVNDEIILIENKNPITQSVLDTIAMRKDPLAATKLVSTSAAIKEKMYAKMGPKGKFLFNDQFSEVSLTDLNGNNLCDNKHFSFVGINDKAVYLSYNTIDSEIIEFPLVNEEKVNEKEDNSDLDVRDFKVEKQFIDNAMEDKKENAGMDISAGNKISEEQVSVPSVDYFTKEESEVPITDESEVADKFVPNEIVPVSFDKIEDSKTKDFIQDFKIEESINKFEEKDENDSDNSYLDEKDKLNEDSSDPLEKTSVSIFDDNKESDNFNFADILNDSRERREKKNFSLEDSFDIDSRDTIFEDAAVVMNRMISQIEEQRRVMSDYEEKLKKLTDFRKKAFEENKKLVNKYENLLKEYKTMEEEFNSMQNLVDRQQEEIKALKSQVAGKNELVRLLSKAQSLLDDDYDKGFSKIKTM